MPITPSTSQPMVASTAHSGNRTLQNRYACRSTCPPGLGGHPSEHDHQAVWWCNGGEGGHVVAMIGRWSG